MQIRVDARILGDSLLVIVCFLEVICSHGLSNVKPHFLSLVLKQNAKALLMWFLSHVGYAIFFWSCPIQKATLVYCYNVGAIYLSRNPV